MPDVDPSHKERTSKRSNKGKGLVEKSPSSSKDKSLMETTPRWLNKEVMVRTKRQLYCSEEDGTKELVEALKKPKLPTSDAQTLTFIMRNQNQDFFTHISIPPL